MYVDTYKTFTIKLYYLAKHIFIKDVNVGNSLYVSFYYSMLATYNAKPMPSLLAYLL